MFVLLLFCVAMLVILVKDVMRKRNSKWRHLSKFPGDPPLPVIGNALDLGFDSDEASRRLLEMWKRHGKTNFRVSVGYEDWVLLTEPDDVRVLFSDSTILSKSPERNAAVKPFFGESVSTSEGDRWRWSRKLILSSFHAKSIGQRLAAINKQSDRLIRILQNQSEDGPLSMYRYLRPYMLDVLFGTLMGIESDFMDEIDDKYLTESGKVINMITTNYFSYWRNIKPLFILTPMYREMQRTIQTIQDTAADVIAKRKHRIKEIANQIKINNKVANVDVEEIIQNKITEDNTLIDSFLFKKLPNGNSVPEDVIKEEISFVYFTGHFTTAVTISHALYCLAKNPSAQNRVIEELNSIFRENFSRKPSMEDLSGMKYLDAVIKETLRMIPTVPKIGRKLKKNLVLKDGRIIPAGTTAIVFYEAMFSNEKQFPDPHKFRPERFFEDSIHPHAFLPFGGGPRSCIGFRFALVAIKATLSNILRRFEVTTAGPAMEPQFTYGVVTESKNDISLIFTRRSS